MTNIVGQVSDIVSDAVKYGGPIYETPDSDEVAKSIVAAIFTWLEKPERWQFTNSTLHFQATERERFHAMLTNARRDAGVAA